MLTEVNFEDLLESHSTPTINEWYVDGSYIPQTKVAGWAAFNPKQNQYILGQAKNENSSTAELLAIKKLIEHLNKGEQATIYTDYYPAVSLFMDFQNSTNKNKPLIKSSHHLIHKKGLQINLQWIPAHSGIYGNEAVHLLAYQAAKEINDTNNFNCTMQQLFTNLYRQCI
jgi:ribonuclease HI